LLALLGWSAEQLAYALREDDFLFAKLGSLKPYGEPLRYRPPDDATRDRAAAIARAGRNPLARRVKIADLDDNLDLTRIPNLTEKDYRRVERYQRALVTLRGYPADSNRSTTRGTFVR
jgi:hypothetical protein